jgi:type 1 glutamine amidotransferase
MSSPPLRTAVFCHDTWHPAGLIRQGLTPLARDDFRFEWLDTPTAWTSARLTDWDLIVLAKGNTTATNDQSPWLTPEIEDAVLQHVRAGKGLFIVHAGTCYRNNARLRALTGGAFLQHPPPCPVTLEPQTGHPVTVGVHATTVHDEHYEMVLDDPQAAVFLRTRSQHGVQPAGWTRQENGRICVLTPGHTQAAWEDPQFQKLLHNGLRWAAGKSG